METVTVQQEQNENRHIDLEMDLKEPALRSVLARAQQPGVVVSSREHPI